MLRRSRAAPFPHRRVHSDFDLRQPCLYRLCVWFDLSHRLVFAGACSKVCVLSSLSLSLWWSLLALADLFVINSPHTGLGRLTRREGASIRRARAVVAIQTQAVQPLLTNPLSLKSVPRVCDGDRSVARSLGSHSLFLAVFTAPAAIHTRT
jgi:hypothetical protein